MLHLWRNEQIHQIKMTRGDPDADRETYHPAVIAEPETGEQALFLNPIYTTRFEGMTEEESRPYLEAIYKHATRPDFSYRHHHRWQAEDVVVWNNRTTFTMQAMITMESGGCCTGLILPINITTNHLIT